MTRFWKIAETTAVDSLQGIHPSALVRRVLWNRGVKTEGEAQAFLKPDYARDLHDPFLFRDMEKAAARILKAVEEKEKIAIHGDYDADGVCSSAILATTLEYLGNAPRVHLPHRMEDGYGVKTAAIDEFAKEGVSLLITVDCGIANHDAVAHARKQGIDTVIVDHHAAQDTVPEAHAIIHCDIPGESYPFRKLSAGGVAFKVAQALMRTARFKTLELSARNVEAFEKWLLDLVAISTVADVMPLVGENRTLVRYGLQVLARTQRKGLQELFRQARIVNGNEAGLTVRNIAYHIAPRINAAGRMEHASIAYDLINATDESLASKLAEMLEERNRERQRVTDEMLSQSRLEIREEDNVIVVANAKWSVGLVGLVAGKLSDEYGVPAFVLGTMNGNWTGSCRGPEGFSCTDALNFSAELLDHWGGHAQAAGFTLKQELTVAQFNKKMRDYIKSVQSEFSAPALHIDAEVSFKKITQDVVEVLESLEPFGEGNPPPLLLTRHCTVSGMRTVGKGDKHIKCEISDTDNITYSAIAFNHGLEENQVLEEGAEVDIIYEPKLNHWNGNSTIELYVRDARKSE